MRRTFERRAILDNLDFPCVGVDEQDGQLAVPVPARPADEVRDRPMAPRRQAPENHADRVPLRVEVELPFAEYDRLLL